MMCPSLLSYWTDRARTRAIEYHFDNDRSSRLEPRPLFPRRKYLFPVEFAPGRNLVM